MMYLKKNKTMNFVQNKKKEVPVVRDVTQILTHFNFLVAADHENTSN